MTPTWHTSFLLSRTVNNGKHYTVLGQSSFGSTCNAHIIFTRVVVAGSFKPRSIRDICASVVSERSARCAWLQPRIVRRFFKFLPSSNSTMLSLLPAIKEKWHQNLAPTLYVRIIPKKLLNYCLFFSCYNKSPKINLGL